MKNILERTFGNFGIWQLRTVLIIYLSKIPASWFMACIIFTAPEPKDGEVFCRQPSQFSHLNTSSWIAMAHPRVKSKRFNRTQIDYCHVYENVTIFTDENFQDSIHGLDIPSTIYKDDESVDCENFVHEPEFYSLIVQYNLVCSKEILIAWTQFFHLFGVLLGGIIGTRLMDHISPRRVMLTGMLTQIMCGILTGYATNYEIHVFVRCLSAICCALMFTAGTVIFSEITGGDYRIGVNTLFDQFWSIGVILLPGLSSFFTDWAHIYLAISIPTVILIFLYPWIPDAPKWLLKQGRIEEAEYIIRQGAEINERTFVITPNLTEELKIYAEQLKNESFQVSWWEIWRGPYAKTTAIAAHLAWAIYVVNFNGMLLNIRSFGRDYLVINTIVTGISEIVGCFLALYFTLCTKHKWQFAGIYNIITGAMGFLGWIFPDTFSDSINVLLWMVISSIAKAGVSISQSMLMGCTSELVPPNKRVIFTFSCIVFARIWLLTAPFINVFQKIDTAFSLSFFTFLQIIGGIATILFKPEISSKSSTEQNQIKNLTITIPNQNQITTKIGKNENIWTVTSSQ